MKKYYIIYDINTGRLDGGHGRVEEFSAFVTESIPAIVAKKPTRASVLLDGKTKFKPKTQKVENGAVVDLTAQELQVDKDYEKDLKTVEREYEKTKYDVVIAALKAAIPPKIDPNFEIKD